VGGQAEEQAEDPAHRRRAGALRRGEADLQARLFGSLGEPSRAHGRSGQEGEARHRRHLHVLLQLPGRAQLRHGLWRRELLDAKYAGLDFLLLNTYGPDIENGKLKPLATALSSVDDPVKIALFDDTWTWGQTYFSEAWKKKPDLNDTEAAAKLIYEMKWKPFFSQVDKRYWYRFKGKPFIYFYNAGTLLPRTRSAALITRLKEMFAADFHEEAFVDADSAYFEDAAMEKAADARYQWFTFNSPERRSRSTLKGHVIDHAMVKWDAVGRDRPLALPRQTDLIIKDASVLSRVLDDTRDSELLVIATWNDLGEGTGIHRNYDYYFHGQWQRPDYFMQLIRRSQEGL
jgi:hypothetical protein